MTAAQPSVWASWSLEPLQLAPLALAGTLYAARVWTLRRRGERVPPSRVLLVGVGAGLVLCALVTPLNAFAERQFQFCHMIQHLLLGDLGPLCVALGLTASVLGPLGLVRLLAHPAVALPLWLTNLAVWHIRGPYEAALRHESIHAIQHLLLFGCATLLWAPALRGLGPRWFGMGARLVYVAVIGVAGTVLANIFIWSGGAFYSLYERAPGRFGMMPEEDQRIAGGVMMLEGSVVTLAVLAWLLHTVLTHWERRA